MASENYVQEMIEESAPRFFSCPEAEENILRRMLTSRGVADDTIDELSGKDFADITLGRLFSAIKLVLQDGAQVDFATVDAAFSKRFPKNAETMRERMIDLMAPKPYSIGSDKSIADHIRIVKELSSRRAAIANMDALAQSLRDPAKDVTETLAEIREAVDKVDSGGDDWTSISDVLLNTFDYLEKRNDGIIKPITSGIPEVDGIIGGFYPGEMTVVAARPSVGKSAFGMNIALEAAIKGFKTGIVSLEMVDTGFGQRLFSKGAYIDGTTLRQGVIDPEAWSKLADILSVYGDLPIGFMFRCNTIEDVCAAARRRAKHGKLDLLVVDYIGIMQTRKRFRERREKIGYISWSLKQLAIQANIPVIALAQVNRDAQGNMPTMANLRDSGDIEQDADGIIFLHHPKDSDDPALAAPGKALEYAGCEERGMNYIIIDVAKQRQGKIGRTAVAFKPETMQYTRVDRRDG